MLFRSLRLGDLVPDDAVPPFKVVYSPLDSTYRQAGDEDSIVDSCEARLENAKRKKQLKRNHFQVKGREIQKKRRYIRELECAVVNQRAGIGTGLEKASSSISIVGPTKIAKRPSLHKHSMASLSKPVSNFNMLSKQMSFADKTTVNKLNLIRPVSSYDKYISGIREGSKPMPLTRMVSAGILHSRQASSIDIHTPLKHSRHEIGRASCREIV